MTGETVVQVTQKTSVRGNLVSVDQSDRKVNAFLGIPYAQPPVGELRFQPTKSLTLPVGTLDATEYGSVCPQEFGPLLRWVQGGDYEMPKKVSEDCLYLNIWTPTPKKDAKLPVMVWIHGGAYANGFGSFFNGTGLAGNEDVVVVTLNYRLGIFGLLHLGIEKAQGNMALHDMLEALRWVQTHIEAFGGDKDNITLFGESAGSHSTNILCFSPEAKGLVHKVVFQSAVVNWPNSIMKPEDAKQETIARAREKGCPGKTADEVFEWINSKSSQELVDTIMDMFMPVVDGKIVVDHVDAIYQHHEFHKIPLLIGFTEWECAMFQVFGFGGQAVLPSREKAKETLDSIMTGFFYRFFTDKGRVKKLCDAAWDLYVGDLDTNPESVTASLEQLLTDGLFAAGHIEVASFHSEKVPTYLYLFTHRPVKSTKPVWVGADHTDEIQYIFGFPFSLKPETWSEEERTFSKMMMTYWANFARTGNPNGKGLPKWDPYTKTTGRYMILSGDPRLSAHYSGKRVLFWNVTARKILRGEE